MNATDERDQRIRERAYQLWVEAGQPEGKEQEHWDQAKAEIEGQTQQQPTAHATPEPTGTSFGP